MSNEKRVEIRLHNLYVNDGRIVDELGNVYDGTEGFAIRREVEKFSNEFVDGVNWAASRREAHHKRKRCFAWLEYFKLREDEFGGEYYRRWIKRWTKLAEYYKEKIKDGK